jgi:hypothetical protein
VPNAIDAWLRLKPQGRITVKTDTVTRGITAALQSELQRVGSKYSLFVLEHHEGRPLVYMPEFVVDDLVRAMDCLQGDPVRFRPSLQDVKTPKKS